MSDELKLLPCPFCGGEAYISGEYAYGYFVGCQECYCNLGEGYDRDACPEHMFGTAEYAAIQWNTRKEPAP